MIKKISLALVALVVISGLTGCIKFKKEAAPLESKEKTAIFVSPNRGDTWLHKINLLTPDKAPGTISNVEVTSIAMDPSDTNAIYIGTKANGVYYSYNGGDGWTQALSLAKASPGPVTALAIDPEDKCNIFAGIKDRIFKTSDCSRNWTQVLKTAKTTEIIKAIAIDWYDSEIMYAAASDGSIYKSVNNGLAWAKSVDLEQPLSDIAISRRDSRVVFAASAEAGIFRTVDAGGSWDSLRETMNKKFEGSSYRRGYFVEVAEDQENVVFYLSKFGLLKSADGGDTWEQIKLLTTEGQVVFNAFKVDPKDSNNLYIADSRTLYRSLDGGATWETRELPSNQVLTDIQVHRGDNKLIYTGFKKQEQN